MKQTRLRLKVGNARHFQITAYWLLLVAAVAAMGCISNSGDRRRRQATNLMQYLYHGDTERIVTPSIPHLTLPLKVGVAFVPDTDNKDRFSNHGVRLPETFKTELLDRVSGHFRNLPFVRSIEVIPASYLRPGGGFENLEQLRQLFGIDVIALVSFDQVQNTDQGLLALTYWTLVGAYLVPAEKNQTTTLLDAAVFDIRSRRLLFRAPGSDTYQRQATPINLSEALRLDAQLGFQRASSNLVTQLNTELVSFQQRVRDRPADFQIAHSPSYKAGAGALGTMELVFLLTISGILLWNRERFKPTGAVSPG